MKKFYIIFGLLLAPILNFAAESQIEALKNPINFQENKQVLFYRLRRLVSLMNDSAFSMQEHESYHVILDAKTKHPKKALDINFISTRILLIERFLSHEDILREYQPGGSQADMYVSDMRNLVSLVHAVQDHTKIGDMPVPIIKAYAPEIFKRQSSQIAHEKLDMFFKQREMPHDAAELARKEFFRLD